MTATDTNAAAQRCTDRPVGKHVRPGQPGRAPVWVRRGVGALVAAAVAGWLLTSGGPAGRFDEVALAHPGAAADPPARSHVISLGVNYDGPRLVDFALNAVGSNTILPHQPTSTSPSEDVRTSAANAAEAVYAMTGDNVDGADPLVAAGTSGSSAGLAYALTLLEAAGHGQLIPDGALVAATGTITADGTVGPVGGYEYKFPAAEQAGATLLLGPTETPADMQSRYAATFHPVANLAEAARLLCDTYHSSDDICRPVNVRVGDVSRRADNVA